MRHLMGQQVYILKTFKFHLTTVVTGYPGVKNASLETKTSFLALRQSEIEN